MNARHIRWFLLIAACQSSATFAQSSAALRGTVVDPQSRPINSARLSLFSYTSPAQMDQVQTTNGRFEFAGIQGGRYFIEASAEGFRRTTIPVDFQPGTPASVEVRLEIEGLQQEILVTAEAVAQSMDEVAKSVSVIDRAEMDHRDEYSLTETLRNTPGLVIRNLGGPGQSTTIRSRGLRPDATAILIDGMRFRDPSTAQGDAGSFLSSLNIINPERVEVLRGSGSSLYGTNAIGGIVNVVTEQGGPPTHADVQLEGGDLGLLRGRATLGGGAFHNRLLYSGGLLHLNVMSGVDGDDRARSTGAQSFARYRLRDGLFASVRFLGSDDFVQPNISPTATGIPAANIPGSTIVPAVPWIGSQAGNATFIPSRDDPDNRRASRFYSTAFKLEQSVNPSLNWQLSYQHVNTNRIFQNGPAGIGTQPPVSNRSQFTGGIDTVDAKIAFRIRPWYSISGGYEFERETYFDGEDNNLPGSNRVATETRVRQISNAAYIQNQLSLLNQKLQISVSGRSQSFDLQRPLFVTAGVANNYATIALSAPPRALTGDVALSYFAAGTGTKFRAHAGNAYRAPGLYERFGSGFFFSPVTNQVVFTPYGDPRLPPDRYNSFDTGVDQYFAAKKVRISATYFYTRIVHVILFDSAGTAINPAADPFGRTSGYVNGAGGISRGVELSAEAQPTRSTVLNASYTYTNANTDQDIQVSGFFNAFAVPAHAFTGMVNQRFGKKTDVTVDLYQASEYFNPLFAAGRARAYLYPALTKLDAVVSRVMWAKEDRSLRWYGKIDNLLNRQYFETGFRTPGITWISGLRMSFR